MRIDILTIFPSMFDGFLSNSIIKRAIAKGLVEINIIDIRPFSLDKNKRIDDYPLGGGAGLIMKCQPVLDALKSVKKDNSNVILMSPRGEKYNQKIAHELIETQEHLIFICGHYEGLDERINKSVDRFLSIGDYILTGGELPAMVISDSLIRLIDGAINNDSISDESFENGLLEYPQYTLPRVYEDDEVPLVLFSGNHKVINKWRLKESLRLTKKMRPDLLENRQFSKDELKLIKELQENIEEPKWLKEAIEKAKKFL